MGITAHGCGEDQDIDSPRNVGDDHEIMTKITPASAEDCPHGGTIVSAGLDLDDDGILDEDEVSSREVVCLDRTPTVLTRFDRQGPSDTCPQGGYAVHSGLDNDSSGTLDDGEISATEHVCADAVLTRLEPEAAGARCAAAGIAFHTGLDIDRSGTLDDDEISATDYQCGAILQRDLTISTAADMELLAEIQVIMGSLTLEAYDASIFDMPALQSVEGDLIIHDNANLEAIHLPALSTLGSQELGFGALQLNANPALKTVDIPNLTHIHGPLIIRDNDALADVGGMTKLSSMRGISLANNERLQGLANPITLHGGVLHIIDNGALASIEATGSASTGSRVRLTGNTALVTANISLSDAYDVDISNNAALADLQLTTRELTAAVSIQQNPLLTTLRLDAGMGSDIIIEANPSLEEATIGLNSRWDGPVLTGDLIVRNNDQLTSLSTSSSQGLGGSLIIADNDTLTELHANLAQIMGSLIVTDNASLQTIRANGLCHVAGDYRIANAPITEFSVSCDDDRQCTVDGSVIVHGTNMEELDLRHAFDSIGAGIDIQGNRQLHRLDVRTLDEDLNQYSPQYLHIRDNPALGSVNLPQVVRGDVAIENNDTLVSTTNGHDQQEIWGDYSVANNASLQQLGYGGSDIRGRLTITGNPALTIVDLSSLTDVGSMAVVDNDALESLAAMTALRSIAQDLIVEGNSALTTIGLTALERAVSLNIIANPILVGLDLPSLTSLQEGIIRDNPTLPTCAAHTVLDRAQAHSRTVEGNDDDAICL